VNRRNRLNNGRQHGFCYRRSHVRQCIQHAPRHIGWCSIIATRLDTILRQAHQEEEQNPKTLLPPFDEAPISRRIRMNGGSTARLRHVNRARQFSTRMSPRSRRMHGKDPCTTNKIRARMDMSCGCTHLAGQSQHCIGGSVCSRARRKTEPPRSTTGSSHPCPSSTAVKQWKALPPAAQQYDAAEEEPCEPNGRNIRTEKSRACWMHAEFVNVIVLRGILGGAGEAAPMVPASEPSIRRHGFTAHGALLRACLTQRGIAGHG
jgi:hypothetical protein